MSTYIQLPPEVILKIERDAQNKVETFLESLKGRADQTIITCLVDIFGKQYKESEGTKWFLIERHKNAQKELQDGYEELLKVQNDKIEELLTQLEMVKNQIR